jgi:SAM-dependent methyltransferase
MKQLTRIFRAATFRAPYLGGHGRLQRAVKRIEAVHPQSSLDLGSGPSPRNPFSATQVFGIDIRSYQRAGELVRKCNLGLDPIPFPAEEFDCVTAYDVLEHIPRTRETGETLAFPVVELMNEVWRVLKPGGYFFSITPCFPMREAFQDPTHVNIMTEDTLRLYFGDKAWARIYGFEGTFSVSDEGWAGTHYWCVMRKTSSAPVLDRDAPQQP